MGRNPEKDKEKRDVTRRSLIKAGRAIVLINGFNETGVRDIVKEAKVAIGTFYTYFKNLDEFFVAVTEEAVEGLRQEIREARGVQSRVILANPIEAVRHSLQVYLDYIDSNREVALFLLRQRHSLSSYGRIIQKAFEEVVQDFIEDFEMGKKFGIVRNLPSDLVAEAIMGMSLHLGQFYASKKNENLNKEKMLDAFTEIVWSGIASDKKMGVL